MLSVKEAAGQAERWIREMYPQREIPYLRVEEFELSVDDGAWLITVGWAVPLSTDGPLFPGRTSALRALPRVYKVLEVDAETGEVRSMKIREVAR